MKQAVMACLLAFFAGIGASAQEKPPAETPKREPARSEPARSEAPRDETTKRTPTEAPKAEQSVTAHSIAIGGATVNYTATAGTLVVRDEEEEPVANIGYVAYVKRGADPSARPITFAYNGGPGSSSVWLHMGALGPRRIVVTDGGVHSAASLCGGRQRREHPRPERPRDDRPRGNRDLPCRGQGEGQGLLGGRSRHRVRFELHPRVRHGERTLEFAEVPPWRELRHDPFGRDRRPPPEPRRHGVQRRHPRVGRPRSRGDLQRAGQRPALRAVPPDLRRGCLVPQGAAEPARKTRALSRRGARVGGSVPTRPR